MQVTARTDPGAGRLYEPGPWAVVSYINASFLDDISEFPVRFDPKIFAVAEARAKLIMAAASPTDLKPEGAIAGGAECDFCPFVRSCGRQRRAVPYGVAETKDPEFDSDVAALAILAQGCKRRGRTSSHGAAVGGTGAIGLLRGRGVRRTRRSMRQRGPIIGPRSKAAPRSTSPPSSRPPNKPASIYPNSRRQAIRPIGWTDFVLQRARPAVAA